MNFIFELLSTSALKENPPAKRRFKINGISSASAKYRIGIDAVIRLTIDFVGELVRMGADMRIKDNTVFINGVPKLEGTTVMGTDLRATAALVIAGLAAEGTTEVTQVEHIFRGYENVIEKFEKIGAKIKYVPGGVPEI